MERKGIETAQNETLMGLLDIDVPSGRADVLSDQTIDALRQDVRARDVEMNRLWEQERLLESKRAEASVLARQVFAGEIDVEAVHAYGVKAVEIEGGVRAFEIAIDNVRSRRPAAITAWNGAQSRVHWKDASLVREDLIVFAGAIRDLIVKIAALEEVAPDAVKLEFLPAAKAKKSTRLSGASRSLRKTGDFLAAARIASCGDLKAESVEKLFSAIDAMDSPEVILPARYSIESWISRWLHRISLDSLLRHYTEEGWMFNLVWKDGRIDDSASSVRTDR